MNYFLGRLAKLWLERGWWRCHGKVVARSCVGSGPEQSRSLGQGPGENHQRAPRAGAVLWDGTLQGTFKIVHFSFRSAKIQRSWGHVTCSSKVMWKRRLQFGRADESKAKGMSTFLDVLSIAWKYLIPWRGKGMGYIIFLSHSVFNGKRDTSCFHSVF